MTNSVQHDSQNASEEYIRDVQTRMWSALKSGYEYSGMADDSEEYLRPRVRQRLDLTVLYVDLVGSTTMSLEMSHGKFATIISSFAHEMAHVVSKNNGYVLKFVGDAVLAYFPVEHDSTNSADNSIKCAIRMIDTITFGLNPILNQLDYPDLRVKIGIDMGQAIGISYGNQVGSFPIDLIGPPMNIAAKIQSLANPNQVLVGDDVYAKLSPAVKKHFEPKIFSDSTWRYRSRISGELYGIYAYHPSVK